MPAPTPPTVTVEFRGGPYAGETRNMCEPLRDWLVVADPASLPVAAYHPAHPDPALAMLVGGPRQALYRLDSYYEPATQRVGHVYVYDEVAPPPARPAERPPLDIRATVLEWAELIALAEAGTTKTGPPCQACGSPLGASPSDDFCDAACQRAFHATGAEPLDESVPDGWPSWADPVPYGDRSIRADECVEGQRPRPGQRRRPGPYGHTDGPDGCDVEYDEDGGCGGCSCHMGHAPCGHCTDVAETPPDDDRGVSLFGVLLAQLEQTQLQRMAHLLDVVAVFETSRAAAAAIDAALARDQATSNREGDQCAATPDAAASPESSTEPPSTGTGAPPEASPT